LSLGAEGTAPLAAGPTLADERALLAEETEILTRVIGLTAESDLAQAVADGILRALPGTLGVVIVTRGPGSPSTRATAPSSGWPLQRWDELAQVVREPGNASLLTSRLAGCWTSADLSQCGTPIERWLSDRLGFGSAAIAARRTHSGFLLVVAALRRHPGPWSAGEEAFLGRLSGLMEIGVGRLRASEMVASHAAQLGDQADLLAAGSEILATLSTAEEVSVACDAISSRLREFFHADHVALGTIHLSERRREMLGFSSSVLAREDLPAALPEEDIRAYGAAISGAAEHLPDLDIEGLNPGTNLARTAGLRSLIRAPFHLSDGSVGLVSVASLQSSRFDERDAGRLQYLCRPIGIAIDRVRLLAGMAEATNVLEARTRVLAALGPGATIESVGEVFVAEARRLFGATHAVFALFQDGEPRVPASSSDHLSGGQISGLISEMDNAVRSRYREALDTSAQPILDLERDRPGTLEQTYYETGLRTLMRVPIRDSEGHLGGVVTMGSPVPHCWNERDVNSMLELSRSLGLVAERAALLAAAEDRNVKVAALTRLLSSLNANAPPEEVAKLFAREVRRYLDADGVLVYAFDHETGDRIRVALDTTLPELTFARRNPLSESTSYHGTRDQARAIYDSRNPESGPAWIREAAPQLGLGSVVAVRLDAHGAPVGMIAAGTAEPGRLGRAELDLLSGVAGPLALVLERARVVTTLQQQSQRTRAVLDILTALGMRDSLEDVAGPVASALRAMYGADHCAIGTISDGRVRLVGIDSVVADWPRGMEIGAASFLDSARLNGSVLHVYADLAAHDDLSETSALARDNGMRSSMRVLVGAASDPLGVVTVGSRQPARFSEHDARQLGQIVQPLAVAIGYFRGLREAARRAKHLEFTNRVLTKLSAGGAAEHLAAGFLAECRGLFGSSHSMAIFFDHERQMARPLALDSDVLNLADLGGEQPISSLRASHLISQPTPDLVTDARLEPEPLPFEVRLIQAGLYSVMRAPLVVQETVRGAVTIWGEGAGRFGVEDMDLLATLVRPFATALEKAAALESLGESELKYRSLVSQADEMIYLFDSATRRVLDANAHTAQALGYSLQELLSLRLDDIAGGTPEELLRDIEATLRQGELRSADHIYRRKDGALIDVDVVTSLVAFGRRQAILVLARDVSERKALQRQLVQSQKMESLGVMAGAVAHDFNNLLTTILGFAGLLKRSPNMDGEERENLGLIEDAARRAADLTGRLLSFSRGGLVRVGRVDLRDVIHDTMRLAEPTMHAGLAVSTSLPAQPVHVEGDAGQLQRALTNIILNARDAMPEGGDIKVALAADGFVARITIEDNGPGMNEETRTRIFEPFYTTKPLGSGTGLGMAITYGIIQGHHGDVTVQSAPGRGTTFAISLPLLAGAPADDVPDAFNVGEGNLVLVVDDDDMVRRTTTATLAELGYNVVEAPGGAMAIEIMRARPDRFSVVLLDLVMPGLTGSETFRGLTAIRPDLPVIVCTGYAADSHIDTDVKRRIAGLVQKPFTAERLQRALTAAGAKPTRVRT
jgi:PAS domain S-box-containing protein